MSIANELSGEVASALLIHRERSDNPVDLLNAVALFHATRRELSRAAGRHRRRRANTFSSPTAAVV